MAYALKLNKPVKPESELPMVKVKLGPPTTYRIMRFLGARERGLTEGPYADRKDSIAGLASSLDFIDRDKPLSFVVLSLAFFLSPGNANIQTRVVGVSDAAETPRLVGDTTHIHKTENPLVAGELVSHSRYEAPLSNVIPVSTAEEVYLLFASVLRRWGFQAQLGLIGSVIEGMYSVLCVVDGKNCELFSVGFPTHPKVSRIIILDDREVEGVVHFLNALNRTKRLAAATELDDVALEQLALSNDELSRGRAILDHPLREIIESLRPPLVMSGEAQA